MSCLRGRSTAAASATLGSAVDSADRQGKLDVMDVRWSGMVFRGKGLRVFPCEIACHWAKQQRRGERLI